MARAGDIAGQLGRALREGRGWRTTCPVHFGYSLNLADGRDGRLLVTCWAGCPPEAILAELRRLDLDGWPDRESEERREGDGERTLWAQRLWDRAREARGSPIARYFASRGITVPPPLSLRWLPRCKHPSGIFLPAMVAKVVNVDGELTGVHRTFLAAGGEGKAAVDKEQQKMSLGPVAGGAVRLAPLDPRGWLAITEGIETGLAVLHQTGIPTWAALSTSGIKSLILPSAVARVVICADNDANGRGEAAARNAAARWLSEGREVRLAMPPETGSDFNDMLLRGEF